MVSASLIVLLVVLGFFAVAFVYVLFFKVKGRKLRIEIYELYGGKRPVLVNEGKKEFGLIMSHEDKKKFKIPKKYSQTPITPPPSHCIVRTKGKFDMVRLLKVSEGIFVFLEHEIQNTESNYVQYINEQTEPFAWTISETKSLQERTRVATKWEKYGPLVVLGVIILGGILSIYLTGQQITELTDGYRAQVLGEIKEDRSFMLEVVNNIKADSPNNVEPSPNADVPPSRQ